MSAVHQQPTFSRAAISVAAGQKRSNIERRRSQGQSRPTKSLPAAGCRHYVREVPSIEAAPAAIPYLIGHGGADRCCAAVTRMCAAFRHIEGVPSSHRTSTTCPVDLHCCAGRL
jgi:hypothetical protein